MADVSPAKIVCKGLCKVNSDGLHRGTFEGAKLVQGETGVASTTYGWPAQRQILCKHDVQASTLTPAHAPLPLGKGCVVQEGATSEISIIRGPENEAVPRRVKFIDPVAAPAHIRAGGFPCAQRISASSSPQSVRRARAVFSRHVRIDRDAVARTVPLCARPANPSVVFPSEALGSFLSSGPIPSPGRGRRLFPHSALSIIGPDHSASPSRPKDFHHVNSL